MNIRKAIYAAAVIILVVAVWLALDWIIVSDEERIETALDAMQDAAEEADVQTIMSYVAERYQHEGKTREDWKRITRNYFRHFGPTRVWILSKDIRVQGNLASVELALHARTTSGLLKGRTNWHLSWQKRREPQPRGEVETWKITKINLHEHRDTNLRAEIRHLSRER